MQRESRGTLMEWLVSAAAPVCESCEKPLYEHANSYQDGLLQTLLQADAAARTSGLAYAPKLPLWCGAENPRSRAVSARSSGSGTP
jgi:hypothetical protein